MAKHDEPVPFVYPEGSIQEERSKAIGKAVPVIIIIIVLSMLAFPAWILGNYLAGFQSQDQRYADTYEVLDALDYESVGKIVVETQKSVNHSLDGTSLTVIIEGTEADYRLLQTRFLDYVGLPKASKCTVLPHLTKCSGKPLTHIHFNAPDEIKILIRD